MKKILIIDDDEIFAKIITDSLDAEKYKVIHVSNGEEGLKMLEIDRPDLIILDLLMPVMSGLQFLKALREKNEPRNVPILISSQLSQMHDLSTAVTSGMDVGVKGYIVKASQNLDTIIKTIENNLR